MKEPIQVVIARKKEQLRKARRELRAEQRNRRDSKERSPAWDNAGHRIKSLTREVQELEEFLRTLPW